MSLNADARSKDEKTEVRVTVPPGRLATVV